MLRIWSLSYPDGTVWNTEMTWRLCTLVGDMSPLTSTDGRGGRCARRLAFSGARQPVQQQFLVV